VFLENRRGKTPGSKNAKIAKGKEPRKMPTPASISGLRDNHSRGKADVVLDLKS
jgi:hypothetical protein